MSGLGLFGQKLAWSDFSLATLQTHNLTKFADIEASHPLTNFVRFRKDAPAHVSPYSYLATLSQGGNRGNTNKGRVRKLIEDGNGSTNTVVYSGHKNSS
jgi:hypothetical protein